MISVLVLQIESETRYCHKHFSDYSSCVDIIILKVYIAHVSSKQGTQGAEYIQTLNKIAVMNSETLALHRGLQGATAHTAATARNTRANPFSFR